MIVVGFRSEIVILLLQLDVDIAAIGGSQRCTTQIAHSRNLFICNRNILLSRKEGNVRERFINCKYSFQFNTRELFGQRTILENETMRC